MGLLHRQTVKLETASKLGPRHWLPSGDPQHPLKIFEADVWRTLRPNAANHKTCLKERTDRQNRLESEHTKQSGSIWVTSTTYRKQTTLNKRELSKNPERMNKAQIRARTQQSTSRISVPKVPLSSRSPSPTAAPDGNGVIN